LSPPIQHLYSFPTRRSSDLCAQFRTELMLVFRFGKIAQHVGRRSEKNQAPAFVEQDRLVKHLKNFRAWLVNRDDDDFVVRQTSKDRKSTRLNSSHVSISYAV